MIPLPETCVEYQYLFNSYYGPVWRNDSRDWNGSKPIETRMLYTADQLRAYADAVRAEERERCARICDEVAKSSLSDPSDCYASAIAAAEACAAAIRSAPKD